VEFEKSGGINRNRILGNFADKGGGVGRIGGLKSGGAKGEVKREKALLEEEKLEAGYQKKKRKTATTLKKC